LALDRSYRFSRLDRFVGHAPVGADKRLQVLEECAGGRGEFRVVARIDPQIASYRRADQHACLHTRPTRKLPDIHWQSRNAQSAATMLMTVDEKATSNAGTGFRPADSNAASASARDGLCLCMQHQRMLREVAPGDGTALCKRVAIRDERDQVVLIEGYLRQSGFALDERPDAQVDSPRRTWSRIVPRTRP
jgi:hypothetical protein